jgi:hypothetical protein
MSNEKWMSKIQHDPQLIHMVLPASHDAGVYGDSLTRVACPKRYARTQGSNIYNQAMSGSRVFDVRVFLKRIKDENGKSVIEPTMGHFAAEKFKWPKIGKSTGAFGGYGGSFMTAVKDAVAYVKTYQSEFLILRISHTYCPEHVRAALSEFMAAGDNAKYVYNQNGNIATSTLDELRGRSSWSSPPSFITASARRMATCPCTSTKAAAHPLRAACASAVPTSRKKT